MYVFYPSSTKVEIKIYIHTIHTTTSVNTHSIAVYDNHHMYFYINRNQHKHQVHQQNISILLIQNRIEMDNQTRTNSTRIETHSWTSNDTIMINSFCHVQLINPSHIIYEYNKQFIQYQCRLTLPYISLM